MPDSEPRNDIDPGLPPVSIVIPSWNTSDLLLNALRSFLPLQGVEWEVIIVDNASSDGSPEAVEAAFPDVRVIRNDENLGFGGGVNVGLRAARHPFILLLNTDTLVRGDAIEKLIRYAVAHPEAGIVGPRVVNRDLSLQNSYWRFPSLLNLILSSSYLYKVFPDSTFFNRERLPDLDTQRPGPVDAVSGCAFLVRREVVARIGAFDESYFMYAEETDLCFRVWAAGFEVHYAPVGEIVHFGGESSRLVPERMLKEYQRSVLLFFAKNRGMLRCHLARGLLLSFLILRLPYWFVRATAAPTDSAAAARLRNYWSAARFLLQPLSSILALTPERTGRGQGPAHGASPGIVVNCESSSDR